jgi:hypothetical protein
MYSFESSGNVTIIIRALQQTNLMGISYPAGDIVTVFENAYFSLVFGNNNKTITQGAMNKLHYNTINLDRVVIEPKSITHSSYNFLSAKYQDTGNIYIPIKENISSAQNGSAFLNFIPTQDKVVFIKNQDKENVSGYSIDYSTGLVTNLTPNTNYICFYYRLEERLISYDLAEVSLPYFSIEIIGQNNINNISREMLITVPKVAIDINTLMEFKEDQITAIQLNFIVIDGTAAINYY